MVKIIVRAVVMLSVYLIYGAITANVITYKEIQSAFISYILSIILTSDKFNLSLNVENGTETTNKLHNTIVKTKDFTLPIIVQTLICIVGFVLLYIIMGCNQSDLIPTTIALSVGSISGQIILKPKAS